MFASFEFRDELLLQQIQSVQATTDRINTQLDYTADRLEEIARYNHNLSF